MIVVTGGAGFIGSALIAKLNAQGVGDILVVDDFRTSEKWRNLSGKKIADVVHKNDFLDYLTRGDYQRVEQIVHLGACSATTERDFDYLLKNNFEYSKRLCEYAMNKGMRFIYASSGATYGGGERGFEDDVDKIETLRPLNGYGFSKQLFDLWIKSQGLTNRVVGIKYFNVFGPNEYHKGGQRSMILKAYEQLKETGKISLFKLTKEAKRDFVYVKDCSDVMWWLLNNRRVSGILNVGTGIARTWEDLAGAVCVALGIPLSVEYVELPEALADQYQYITQAKIGRLRNAGFNESFMSLESAVKDYVQNYLEKTDRFL